MPPHVRHAIEKSGLAEAYAARPAYQRNDYLSWITRAKTEETSNKRLEQMLMELENGKLYMNMKWSAARSSARTTKKAPASRATKKRTTRATKKRSTRSKRASAGKSTTSRTGTKRRKKAPRKKKT